MTKQEADFIGSMNMCDEISNEAYKKIMCNCKVEEEECEDIEDMPSVTPTRPHGEWIYVQYDGNKNIGNWHCSNCRQICIAMHSMDDAFDFCPNCGADMREGETDAG